MACCMKSVHDKKVACVLLKDNGVPVTLSVANASDMELPATPRGDAERVELSRAVREKLKHGHDRKKREVAVPDWRTARGTAHGHGGTSSVLVSFGNPRTEACRSAIGFSPSETRLVQRSLSCDPGPLYSAATRPHQFLHQGFLHPQRKARVRGRVTTVRFRPFETAFSFEEVGSCSFAWSSPSCRYYSPPPPPPPVSAAGDSSS